MELFRLSVTFQNWGWDGKEDKNSKRAPEAFYQRRSKREFYLIVCEGEKAEPKYNGEADGRIEITSAVAQNLI